MISNEQQLQNTRRKLQKLEEHYERRRRDPPSSARDVTLLSLKRTINELIEEITLYEIHSGEPAHSADKIE